MTSVALFGVLLASDKIACVPPSNTCTPTQIADICGAKANFLCYKTDFSQEMMLYFTAKHLHRS